MVVRLLMGTFSQGDVTPEPKGLLVYALRNGRNQQEAAPQQALENGLVRRGHSRLCLVASGPPQRS